MGFYLPGQPHVLLRRSRKSFRSVRFRRSDQHIAFWRKPTSKSLFCPGKRCKRGLLVCVFKKSRLKLQLPFCCAYYPLRKCQNSTRFTRSISLLSLSRFTAMSRLPSLEVAAFANKQIIQASWDLPVIWPCIDTCLCAIMRSHREGLLRSICWLYSSKKSGSEALVLLRGIQNLKPCQISISSFWKGGKIDALEYWHGQDVYRNNVPKTM